MAKRRAKPIVSARGSSTGSVHSTSLELEPARHQLLAQPLAHEGDQRLAALLAGAPQLVVVGLLDPRPPLGVGLVPLGEHVLGEQVGHRRRHPRAGVHAVGDRGDRRLLDGHIGPEVVEHLAADVAVELGHRVGAAGQPQAHHRHVEPLVGFVAGPVPELHELVEVDAHLAGPPAEVALDQLAREPVDARPAPACGS